MPKIEVKAYKAQCPACGVKLQMERWLSGNNSTFNTGSLWCPSCDKHLDWEYIPDKDKFRLNFTDMFVRGNELRKWFRFLSPYIKIFDNGQEVFDWQHCCWEDFNPEKMYELEI